MAIKITVNVHPGAVTVQFDTGNSQQILSKLEEVMAHLDQLKNAVTANTSAVNSLVQAFEGISAKLEEFKNDPVEIQNIADELSATSAKALATAALANTPAGPNP